MDENEREGRLLRSIPADTFAHRLLLVRAQASHMTVKEAAEKCGLNYGSWSKWERGSLPRDILEVAEAISEGLQVDRDWLLYGGPLTKPEKVRRLRVGYVSRSVRPGGRRPRRLDRTRERVDA